MHHFLVYSSHFSMLVINFICLPGAQDEQTFAKNGGHSYRRVSECKVVFERIQQSNIIFIALAKM